MNPLLSIIVPIYGVEKYIERCARSLFEQTLLQKAPCEIIFVNDCTPDNSIPFLKRIIQECNAGYISTQVIDLPKNEGLFCARHYGLLASSGKYVSHVDSDDFCDSCMFEKMVETAEKESLDMVSCGYVREYTDGARCDFVPLAYETPMDGINWMLKMRQWNIWGKIWRREVAFKAESNLKLQRIRYAEDLLRLIPLCLECQSCRSLPFSLYHYCENSNSLMNNIGTDEFFSDLKYVMDDVARQLPEQYQSTLHESQLKILLDSLGFPKTSATRQWFPNLWTEAKKDILNCKGIRKSHRYILWMATFSYPMASWVWRNLIPLWLRLKW